MDQTVTHKNNELLTTLLGKVSSVESSMDNLRVLVQEKLNPTKREFVDDDFLEKNFGITQNIRYKMIKEGTLRKYKLRGPASKSLYKYDEVVASIEKGLIFPKL